MNTSPTWMLEVYYQPPNDPVREEKLVQRVIAAGGRLDCREAPDLDGAASICLTFEFDDLANARETGDLLRMLGEHVEGPCQYS